MSQSAEHLLEDVLISFYTFSIKSLRINFFKKTFASESLS